MLVKTLSIQVMAIAMVMNGFFFLFGFLVAMLVVVGLRVETDVVVDGRPVEVVVDEVVVTLVVGVEGVELPGVAGVVGVVLSVVEGVDWVVEVVVVLVVVGGACPQLVVLSAAIGIPPEHSMFCTYGE